MSDAAQRIVITGASSGIGAATAIAFAKKNARLMLAARGSEGLEDVARRCREAGGEVAVRTLDVTDAEAVARFADEARAALCGIDLWFSNVGTGVMGRYPEVPIAAHHRVIEANLIGHMNDAHAVLPIFLEQDHGIWVNMISVGGYLATPYAAAYSASKFGLRGFAQALRGEVSKRPRIHICDVYPTFVDTPGIDHAANYTGGELGLPPGALAPEAVAKAVVRLATRPRDTTVLGAPGFALSLTQLLTPNLSAALMNGFLDRYFARSDAAPKTDGAIYAPPEGASGPDGGRRRPDQRRTAAAAAGGVAVAVLGVGALLWRRRAKD